MTTKNTNSPCCRMCRGEDIVEGGCISPKFCPCHNKKPAPAEQRSEWDQLEDAINEVRWGQDSVRVHDAVRKLLLSERKRLVEEIKKKKKQHAGLHGRKHGSIDCPPCIYDNIISLIETNV